MNFWEQFLRLLPWRPWQALAALYWQMTRRKVRARNRLRAAIQKLPFAYDLWISTIEKNSEIAEGAQLALDQLAFNPTFSIILHSRSAYTPDQRARSIYSVEQQIYADWTLLDGGTNMMEIVDRAADADYIVPLRIGDTLSNIALRRFAEYIQKDQSASLLYGDQDELDLRGRRVRPWFKPQWNKEMFLALDFFSSAVAIKATDARRAASAAGSDLRTSLSELLLGVVADADGPIVHVPHILCHADATITPPPLEERRDAVERYVEPFGAKCVAGPFDTVKVNWPLPAERPMVSIIVPTRDKVELLSACLGTLIDKTSYRPFEVIVVDNGSVEPNALSYLSMMAAHPDVRVLRHDQPYNFSAINNRAAADANGSFLCLLNNDTEIIAPNWLDELMRYAVRPEIGAVGAKLLYDDGTIQHAGIVVGLGEAAGHAHRYSLADEPGYFRQPHVSQFVSAVTAACLVVEKAKFEAVGGLDDQDLAIAYNDVDLCLKLQAAGWRNVYVPHAVLYHYESKSRGSDLSADQVKRYARELQVLQERWKTKSYGDPLHHPNLDPSSETYLLRL